MDRQPDKARHLQCCAGGGEALSRAKEEPLEGSLEDSPISSGNDASDFEIQAGQFDRRRHVGVVDADFANKAIYRRLISFGYDGFRGCDACSWISRTQKCVS